MNWLKKTWSRFRYGPRSRPIGSDGDGKDHRLPQRAQDVSCSPERPISTVDVRLALGPYIEAIRRGRAAIFCGAGISFHSGLPLARPLINGILERSGLSRAEISLVLESGYPFEALLDTLRANGSIRPLLQIFDHGEPTTNHILLAKLVKRGLLRTICTTNFDELIEAALNSEGLLKDQDYDVFYRNRHFERIHWRADRAVLVKLHGTSSDQRSIVGALRQVAKRRGSEHQQGVLKYVFAAGAHETTIVLGYSCSDEFDISPQIETIEGNHKRVLMIEHHPVSNSYSGDTEDIRLREKKNPFKKFGAGERLFCDTDAVGRVLWEECLQEPYVVTRAPDDGEGWKPSVRKWSNQVNRNLANIAGTVLLHVGAHEQSAVHFKRAVSVSRKLGDERNEAARLANLGTVYRALGDSRRAVKYQKRALWVAKKTQHKHPEGIRLGNLADTYSGEGKYGKAIKLYQEALTVLRERSDKRHEALFLAHLGAAYRRVGQPDEAIECSEQALRLAVETGYKGAELDSLGILGLCYLDRNRMSEAIEYLEKALGIARQLGQLSGLGIHLENLSIAYLKAQAYGRAVECLKEAVDLAKGKSSQSILLLNLGVAYNEQHDYGGAIEANERALELIAEHGDRRGEAQALNNIGVALANLGEDERAIEYYDRAFMVSQGTTSETIKARRREAVERLARQRSAGP